MSPAERHAVLTALFGEALELDAGQRADWLAAQPPDLAAELSSLLAHHERTVPALERIRPSDAQLTADAGNWAGRRYGAWQIDRVLGEGGMGMVFAAHRIEGGFVQQAALKLLRTRFPSAAQVDRFRQERQALARLDHPGIARLVDGGESADGELYLVMEQIQGLAIDRYCRQLSLTLAQRIALIEQICAALAYAHRHLIVHRDIKPDNLLVNADGQIKLLDFGIARLLDDADARVGEATLERAWTPAFAAPEQIKGGVITTATDVYALGVVSWLLLSGAEQVPGLAPDLSPRSWQPPSQVAAQSGRSSTARALRGDLDTVVLCALSTAPERRYASVDDYAADLRRALQQQPILARRDAAGYRLWRFLQRHRSASIATAVAVLALLATTAWSLREASRANHEAARADTALTRSDRINQFLWSVLTAPDPAMQMLGWKAGAGVTVADVLDGLEARVDSEFSGDPIAAANVRLALAQGQMAMQHLATARAQIEHSLQVLGPLSVEGQADSDAAREALGVGRQMLARIELARGDPVAAEATVRRALGDFAQARQISPLRRLSAVAAVHDLGWFLAQQGRHAEAEVEYRKAIVRARHELPPGNPILPITLGVLAELRLTRGDAREAAELARESLQLYAAGPAPAARVLPVRVTRAEALAELGELASLSGEIDALTVAIAALESPNGASSGLSQRLAELRRRLSDPAP